MLRLSDNPPPISPVLTDAADALEARTWTVVQTRPRAEKAFAWELHSAGVGYLLPMEIRRYVSGGRRRTSLVPVFKTHVFVAAALPAELAIVAGSRQVHRVLPVVDQRRLRAELAPIEIALRNGLGVNPSLGLPEGGRCRVTGGPLEGLAGRVERVLNECRLVVTLTMLEKSIAIAVDPALLEPIDDDAACCDGASAPEPPTETDDWHS